ncbi:MAG: hypothetical protein AAF570_03510, partial [Bacteroidota bacterium]
MKKISTLVLLCLMGLSASGQNIVYVDQSASGANDGTSWADAYTDLNAALSNVTSGQHVWVAAGIYKPSSGDREIAFQWDQDSVEVYGGFAGTETMLSQRDWQNNTTILSGDIGTLQDASDNSHTLLHGPIDAGGNLLSYAKVDGFTLQDGMADGNNGPNERGAGIYINGGVQRFDIENCTLRGNVGEFGAGMWVDVSEMVMEVNVVNCVFHENEGRRAPALAGATSGNPGFTNLAMNVVGCTFTRNAINDQNWTGLTGIVYALAYTDMDMRIANCTFADNVDTGSGTALDDKATILYHRGTMGAASLQVHNSIFWNNSPRYETRENVTNSSPLFESVVLENCIAQTPKFATGTVPVNVDSLD